MAARQRTAREAKSTRQGGKGSVNVNTETVGRPMEILLIEDSVTSAQFTIRALRNGNIQHRLSWVSDGEEALEFLHRQGKYRQAPRPDLILLDLGLPKKHGREVLAEVKADPDLQDIPVVVLTVSTSQEDMLATQQLNVQGYLTKPVDLQKFVELVRQLKDEWLTGVILPEFD